MAPALALADHKTTVQMVYDWHELPMLRVTIRCIRREGKRKSLQDHWGGTNQCQFCHGKEASAIWTFSLVQAGILLLLPKPHVISVRAVCICSSAGVIRGASCHAEPGCL